MPAVARPGFAFRPTPVGQYRKSPNSGIMAVFAGHFVPAIFQPNSEIINLPPPMKNLLSFLAPGTISLAGLIGTTTFAAQPAHLSTALQLVDEITAAQAVGVFSDSNQVPLNRYGGSWNSNSNPSYLRLANLPQGILPSNNTKCAPLVTHLLQTCYNWSWSAYSFYDPVLKVTKKSASPSPYQYIALLKAGQGFAQQITRLDQVLPGDLLFWWNIGTDASDHAMVIVNPNLGNGKAYPSDHANANPALTGTTYYEVEVLDSSSGVHTNDSRIVPVNGVDTQIAGIGTGTIGLLVDANFAIVGTTWSLPNSDYHTQRTGWLNGLHSRLKLQSATEAVIGRMP